MGSTSKHFTFSYDLRILTLFTLYTFFTFSLTASLRFLSRLLYIFSHGFFTFSLTAIISSFSFLMMLFGMFVLLLSAVNAVSCSRCCRFPRKGPNETCQCCGQPYKDHYNEFKQGDKIEITLGGKSFSGVYVRCVGLMKEGDHIEVNYNGKGKWLSAIHKGPDLKGRKTHISAELYAYSDNSRSVFGTPIRHVRPTYLTRVYVEMTDSLTGSTRVTEVHLNAHASIRHSLPPNWKEVQDPASGKTYYWNNKTQKSTGDRPRATSSKREQAAAKREQARQADFYAEARQAAAKREQARQAAKREQARQTAKREQARQAAAKREQARHAAAKREQARQAAAKREQAQKAREEDNRREQERQNEQARQAREEAKREQERVRKAEANNRTWFCPMCFEECAMKHAKCVGVGCSGARPAVQGAAEPQPEESWGPESSEDSTTARQAAENARAAAEMLRQDILQKENELADQIQQWQINCGMVPSQRGNQNDMSCLQRAGDIRLMYRRIGDIYPHLDMDNESLKAALDKFNLTGDDCRDLRAVRKVWLRLAMQLAPDKLLGKPSGQIALASSIYKVLVDAHDNFKEYAAMYKKNGWW